MRTLSRARVCVHRKVLLISLLSRIPDSSAARAHRNPHQDQMKQLPSRTEFSKIDRKILSEIIKFLMWSPMTPLAAERERERDGGWGGTDEWPGRKHTFGQFHYFLSVLNRNQNSRTSFTHPQNWINKENETTKINSNRNGQRQELVKCENNYFVISLAHSLLLSVSFGFRLRPFWIFNATHLIPKQKQKKPE